MTQNTTRQMFSHCKGLVHSKELSLKYEIAEERIREHENSSAVSNLETKGGGRSPSRIIVTPADRAIFLKQEYY